MLWAEELLRHRLKRRLRSPCGPSRRVCRGSSKRLVSLRLLGRLKERSRGRRLKAQSGAKLLCQVKIEASRWLRYVGPKLLQLPERRLDVHTGLVRDVKHSLRLHALMVSHPPRGCEVAPAIGGQLCDTAVNVAGARQDDVCDSPCARSPGQRRAPEVAGRVLHAAPDRIVRRQLGRAVPGGPGPRTIRRRCRVPRARRLPAASHGSANATRPRCRTSQVERQRRCYPGGGHGRQRRHGGGRLLRRSSRCPVHRCGREPPVHPVPGLLR